VIDRLADFFGASASATGVSICWWNKCTFALSVADRYAILKIGGNRGRRSGDGAGDGGERACLISESTASPMTLPGNDELWNNMQNANR